MIQGKSKLKLESIQQKEKNGMFLLHKDRAYTWLLWEIFFLSHHTLNAKGLTIGSKSSFEI